MDFTSARQNMVDSQVRTNDVPDLHIQEAMAAIPRVEPVTRMWGRGFGISPGCWRPDRESNSGARICSPLRHHSAIRPPEEAEGYQMPPRAAIAFAPGRPISRHTPIAPVRS